MGNAMVRSVLYCGSTQILTASDFRRPVQHDGEGRRLGANRKRPSLLTSNHDLLPDYGRRRAQRCGSALNLPIPGLVQAAFNLVRSSTVAKGPILLTDRIPCSISVDEEYSWLVPITSSFAVLSTK